MKPRELIMKWKLAFSRGISYLSLINSGMIGTMFLMQLKDKGIISFDLSNTWIIYIIGIIVMTLIGVIEIRYLKGYGEEAKLGFNLNPEMVNMRNRLDEIYKIVKEEEE